MCPSTRIWQRLSELEIRPSVFRRKVRLYPCLAKFEACEEYETCIIYSGDDALAHYGNSQEKLLQFPLFERRDKPELIESIIPLVSRFPADLATEIYSHEYSVNDTLYAFCVHGSLFRKKQYLAGPHIDFLRLPGWLPAEAIKRVDCLHARVDVNQPVIVEAQRVVEL